MNRLGGSEFGLLSYDGESGFRVLGCAYFYPVFCIIAHAVSDIDRTIHVGPGATAVTPVHTEGCRQGLALAGVYSEVVGSGFSRYGVRTPVGDEERIEVVVNHSLIGALLRLVVAVELCSIRHDGTGEVNSINGIKGNACRSGIDKRAERIVAQLLRIGNGQLVCLIVGVLVQVERTVAALCQIYQIIVSVVAEIQVVNIRVGERERCSRMRGDDLRYCRGLCEVDGSTGSHEVSRVEVLLGYKVLDSVAVVAQRSHLPDEGRVFGLPCEIVEPVGIAVDGQSETSVARHSLLIGYGRDGIVAVGDGHDAGLESRDGCVELLVGGLALLLGSGRLGVGQ